MKATALFGNVAWWASNLQAWQAFRRSLANPAQAQTEVLRAIVSAAADTAFGKQYGFKTIRNHHDFAHAVPLSTYEDMMPWVDRIRQGERGVLTADPVVSLAATSGTSGGRKLIPYTKSLQRQFNAAIAPWIVDLFHTYPALLAGQAYWSISPAAQNAADESSAVPVGFEDETEYLGFWRRRLADAVMAVPASVRHAGDIETWRRLTQGHLQQAADLRLISIWHPSFLSLLLSNECGLTRQAWPRLKVISCWADGHAASAALELAERFPGVVVQPKGIIATEGIVSIPFARRWPLAIRSHFFEFIAGSGTIVRAQDLQLDQVYEVVLTTAGGLYRYRLGDQVKVDGFIGRTPSVRFVGRSGMVSDLFGEKLEERFVSSVLFNLQRELGVTWGFAMLAPTGDAYTLFTSAPTGDDTAAMLDDRLRANPHYAYCRDLAQLAPAKVQDVGPDGYRAYVSRLERAGARLGDVKPVALSNLPGWADIFSHFTCDRQS